MVDMPTAIEPDPEPFDGLAAGAALTRRRRLSLPRRPTRALRSWGSGTPVFRPKPGSPRPRPEAVMAC